MNVWVTEHCEQRAVERLGSMPPIGWWRACAKRIATRKLRALRTQIIGRIDITRWVVPTSQAGTDVDLVLVAESTRRRDGSTRSMVLVTVWVHAIDGVEQPKPREE
ncbi:MAG TPA: hypothetical protein VM869_35865 [Enhygromyxa sp.]|nr:hypothetical protein [Enhygromyxa sp.]